VCPKARFGTAFSPGSETSTVAKKSRPCEPIESSTTGCRKETGFREKKEKNEKEEARTAYCLERVISGPEGGRGGIDDWVDGAEGFENGHLNRLAVEYPPAVMIPADAVGNGHPKESDKDAGEANEKVEDSCQRRVGVCLLGTLRGVGNHKGHG